MTDEQYNDLLNAVRELHKWMCSKHCDDFRDQHSNECTMTRVWLPKEES